MRAAAFVINQALGSHHFRSACRASAERAGWEPELLITATSGAGAQAATKAVEAGAELVVAAGGDGTVRACAQALAGTGVPLGIVPLGTANLLARALGLPRHPAAALRVALTGRSRGIDLATVGGAGGDMVFTAMAGIGLDAAVVAATRFKRRLGWPAYAIAGAAHLAASHSTFTIRIDDHEPVTRKAQSVVVANCGLLPGGFTIMADVRADDGLLDVGVLAPEGPLGWLRLAEHVIAGDGRLERFTAHRVEITADGPLHRQADGELLTRAATLTATITPGALLVRANREPPGRSG